MRSVDRFLCFASVLLVSTALSGCGDGNDAVIPTSGQIFVDGQPLATGIEGFLQVIPENGRAASGAIDPATGSFVLSTYEKDDGCVAGTHKAIIIMEEAVGQESVSLLPFKYTNINTTDIRVTVESPKAELKIEIQGPVKKKSSKAAPVSDDPNKA